MRSILVKIKKRTVETNALTVSMSNVKNKYLATYYNIFSSLTQVK